MELENEEKSHFNYFLENKMFVARKNGVFHHIKYALFPFVKNCLNNNIAISNWRLLCIFTFTIIFLLALKKRDGFGERQTLKAMHYFFSLFFNATKSKNDNKKRFSFCQIWPFKQIKGLI